MDEGTVALPPLPALIPTSASVNARADLVSLKLRLASLLPPASGQLYWTTLVDFITGKLNREELGRVITRVLGTNGEALRLHNAILLSILYNTTLPNLPPSSLRHTGWQKRKRATDGSKVEDTDPKRRAYKAAVMALGKRERAEIKLKASVKREAEIEPEEGRLGTSFDSRGGRVGADGLPLALADTKAPSATLAQDYMRCLQTPLCCESKMLPDLETLQDRMSLLAYDSGLNGGADGRVAALGVQAVEMHLRDMITSMISLIRSNRTRGVRTTPAVPPSKSLPTSFFTSATTPSIILSNDHLAVPLCTPAEDEQPQEPPLSLADFNSLFEISPWLLVQPHTGALEKLFAIPPVSDDEDDDSDSGSSSCSSDESARGGVASVPIVKATTRTGRSRANTLVGSAPPGGPNAGREQYLIDPYAVPIPMGHPSVASPLHRTTSSLSLPRALPTPPSAPTPLSPKSLRNQLFPELSTSEPSARPRLQRMETNDTSSEGSDSEGEEDASIPGMGTGAVTVVPPGGSRRASAIVDRRNSAVALVAQNGESGRGLFDVVDSRRLLDGVLD